MTCAAAASANASRATGRLLSAALFTEANVCKTQQISKARRVVSAKAAAGQGDVSPDMMQVISSADECADAASGNAPGFKSRISAEAGSHMA